MSQHGTISVEKEMTVTAEQAHMKRGCDFRIERQFEVVDMWKRDLVEANEIRKSGQSQTQEGPSFQLKEKNTI